jgi:hypothetical protein
VPDNDGYPLEEELNRVRAWDPKDGWGLLEYIREIWWNPADIVPNGSGTVAVHTVGWSGNEDIIASMMANRLWWMFHWESSRRGGHYEFKPVSSSTPRQTPDQENQP